MSSRVNHIAVLTTLLLLAACAKVPNAPVSGPVASDDPVEFGMGGQATKGQTALTTLAALQAVDFSVSAWYTRSGETFDVPGGTSVPYFQNHRFGNPGTLGTDPWRGVNRNTSTNALTANPVYYPLDGTLSFFCYAPYRADAALVTPPVPDNRDIVLDTPPADMATRHPDWLVGSPMIRVTPAAAAGTAANQVDFLCSPPLLDKSRKDNSGQLTVDFTTHRLTKITFGFNYSGVLANGSHFVQVSAVEIQGVIASKYLYYTETAPYVLSCAWSDAISPDDKTNPSAAMPLTNYLIDTATGGLDSGTGADLDPKDPGNSNHKMVSTEAGILYLLPQEIPLAAKLVISYFTGEQHGVPLAREILTVPLRNANLTAWPMGKEVRYLITLNIPNQQISGLTAQVFDWEDSGNVHPPQELLPHNP